MLLSAVAIRHDRLEPSTIIGANLDLDPLAHAAIVPRPLASQDSFDCIGALAALKGRWQKGTVRGRLVDAGWGAALGYPGLVLDPLGAVFEVHLFESLELPDHWSRLDAFEGTGYRRVVTPVRTADGELNAWIYVIAP